MHHHNIYFLVYADDTQLYVYNPNVALVRINVCKSDLFLI